MTNKYEASVRVVVMVDVVIGNLFDGSSTVKAMLDSAEEQAEEIVRTLIERYGGAGGQCQMRICNDPKACLVMTRRLGDDKKSEA